MGAHYPTWDIEKNLNHIFEEIAVSWLVRPAAHATSHSGSHSSE